MLVVPTPTTTRVEDLVFRVQGLGTILQEAYDAIGSSIVLDGVG